VAPLLILPPLGAPGLSSYAAAKGGIVQLTRTAALECARQNIRVNAICPGLVWTPMVHSAIRTRVPPPDDVPPPSWVPIGRWGLDTEIAATTVFLASDEAGYLTGAALPVDGGCTAA
jgi:NAD(P)-dependent dehydrogenase (short-subunit alcohol dehydrogenase family)